MLPYRLHRRPDSSDSPAEDRLLSSLAERLRTCVPESVTVAQPGGDGYAAVLTGVREGPSAGTVGNKIVIAGH